ncbi:hypothetical protein CLV84_1793 [Neolewinella xylanilytica]|uniref:Uncharacterized protein n=1 Tax=Neolewinella xylanilytica TaxID=1514080 RepID=A0A2S6IBD6_9BACT|nr:hypothetical protein [Neolewinella xylanilytica]PPK88820.1 hypothetical protein CLV84_1793 [Neolewinella xylanilytica]
MPYREKSLREFANRADFTFSETDDHGLHRYLGDFRLANRGRRRTVSNVLRKQDGLLEQDAYVFDYSYRDFGNKHTTRQTVFFLQSQRLTLPSIDMQPESILHKMGELFGFHDIDFLRFPKFSKQYRLVGEDEDYIRHHFTDEVLNYFTLNKGWSVEGIGYYLIVYKKGMLLPAEEIMQLFQRGMTVYQLFRAPA